VLVWGVRMRCPGSITGSSVQRTTSCILWRSCIQAVCDCYMQARRCVQCTSIATVQLLSAAYPLLLLLSVSEFTSLLLHWDFPKLTYCLLMSNFWLLMIGRRGTARCHFEHLKKFSKITEFEFQNSGPSFFASVFPVYCKKLFDSIRTKLMEEIHFEVCHSGNLLPIECYALAAPACSGSRRQICGSRNVVSASFRRFWPQIHVRRQLLSRIRYHSASPRLAFWFWPMSTFN